MNRFNIVALAGLSSLLILPSAYPEISDQVSNQPTSILANNTLTLEKLRQLAQAVTVKVLSPNKGGSGVLISKQGQTYTIVTNAHVISNKGTHSIQTLDGKTHRATVISSGNSLSGNDLAVLQFQSQDNYQIVTLTTNSNLSENQEVLAAGFPDDSKELVITKGKISLLSPQPLIGGYQIGYTNEIRQGMSGGTLLNQEGKLIGINGLHNNAILNDTYTYQDGTVPNAEEIQRFKKFSFAVPIQTLAKVAPNLAIIPPEWRNQQQAGKPPVGNTLADKINNIAQKITVRIDFKSKKDNQESNDNGSGVIIAKQGNTYYVATARHLFKNSPKGSSYQHQIITPDGKRYAVKPENIIKSDLTHATLIKFTSNERYDIATISTYNQSALDYINQKPKTFWVFLSGFPAESGKLQLNAGYLQVRENSFANTDGSSEVLQNLLNDGYRLNLSYSNFSEPGTSGGPLLDAMGQVIGINGGISPEKISCGEKCTEIGLGYGVPSSSIAGLATQAGIKLAVGSETPNIRDSEINSLWDHPLFAIKKPSTNAKEDELFQYANKLWRIRKFSEAVTVLQQILRVNQNSYEANYLIGAVLTNAEDYNEKALDALEKAVTIKPYNFEAWKAKALVLFNLKKYSLALAAVDKAIEYNDKDFILYLLKTVILAGLERYPEALTAIDKSIEIHGFDLSYLVRIYALYGSKNYQAAVADLNQVIKLNPNNANNYILRGNAYYFLKDNKAALVDYNQAIKLEPNNASAYYSRGNFYKNLKDNKAALADYNKAVKLEPDNSSAYSSRASFYGGLKDNKAALADYNQSIKLQPNNGTNYILRGIFYSVNMKDYQAALTDYKQAIKLQPDDADAYYWRGNIYKELKDNKAALADYNQAIKLQPDNAYAYYWRGYFYKNLENYQAALADLSQAIKLESNNANAYRQRGDVLYQLNNYQEALADFNQAIKLQADNAENYILRGIVRKELNKYQEAREDYNKAIKLQPNNGDAYYWRGEILYLLNKYQEALADSNQALKILPPNDIRPLILRGNIRVKLDDYQAALADYNKAIKLQPNNGSAYYWRGDILYLLNKYQDALKDSNQAIKLKTDSVNNYLLRSRVRKELNDYQAALVDSNQAIKLQPHNDNNYVWRGILHKDLKKYQEALADFNQALKLQPNNANAYYLRGNVYYWLRDYQAALADYNQAIKLQPDDANAYYFRGVVRYLLIDYQAALTDLNQAIKLQPNNFRNYYWRGFVRNGLKDYQPALADCNQTIKLQPNNGAGYYCRGVVYQKQGDDNAALSEYAQALAKDKTFAAANAKIGYIKYERGDVAGAIQEWQKAIQIDSDLTGPQLALAVVLHSRGEQQKALNMAQATLRVDKTLADVEVLKQTLWGEHLIAEAQKLLSDPSMKALRAKH